MYAGTHVGRYEIRSRIGYGGMGEVYSALDHELDRCVAIKLLPAEFNSDEDRISRFRQEARVVSALNHPNIITIYEIGENEFGNFLATEFVDGDTLREIIRRQKLGLIRVLRIIEQAANALVAAHNAGIVHRDIKPENIMVRDDAIVKVLDFGLAKSRFPIGSDEPDTNNKTLPGMVMGSARYMSPEQARGLEVDERTDIWSLGVVLYEMLKGTAPFDGATTADTIAAVVSKEPEPLTGQIGEVPDQLQRIILKALEKDREDRYQHVRDLAHDIKNLIHDLEHADSDDHARQNAALLIVSENPTMIHRTFSGNHPTARTRVMAIDPSRQMSAAGNRTSASALIAAAAAVVILAAISLRFYTWQETVPGIAAAAFERPRISRIDTDGRVIAPTLSPDGKYVAFVSGESGARSLVVRQVATGSMITVVPASAFNIQSVSFSPDGDYIYYTQTNSDYTVNTLFRVPTLGGTARRMVVDVDSAVAFSPDQDQFAFMRHSPKTNEDIVFLVNASTLEARPLISTLETDYSFFSNKLAWSPDGRSILLGAGTMQSGFVTKTDIAEIIIDTRSVNALNTREFFTVNNFAWFTDGSGFVFTARETQNGPAQIWKMTLPELRLYQVTNDLNEYLDLGISADGTSLVTIKGETNSSIWRFSPAGKNGIPLTTESRTVEGMHGLIQKTDGNLVFSRSDGKQADLWTSAADGGNSRILHGEGGFSAGPVPTLDGRYIVFNQQKDKSSRIWRMNADGMNAVRLTEDNKDFSDFDPDVTPDGRTVIFQRKTAAENRLKLMKVSIDGGASEVFYEDEGRGVFRPRISPDGRRIAFGSYDLATFEKRLHIASLDSANFGKIERSFDYSLINGFGWSPDGKSITVLNSRGGAQNLWRQPIDGSAATPITDFTTGRIFNFRWAIDGKSLFIVRGNTNNDLMLLRDSERTAGDIRASGTVRFRDRRTD